MPPRLLPPRALRSLVAAAATTLVALATGACARDAESAIRVRGEAMSYVLAEQVERGVGTSVNLADLAPFRWDRMYVFGPGTPIETVRDSVGAPWPGLARYGRATPDTVSLLVFVAERQVLAAAAHPRRRGDFAPARTGRGYAPSEAIFRVDSAGPDLGRRVLR
ncbi:MAG TPA: hypothetical protein VNS52_06240 [Gemmatimonadaceae bacterium]|nr:hypothetical protein [Gemmatimonadaceae bacterium]